MVYRFSDLNMVKDKFYRLFGIGFMPFYDGLMSVTYKHLCIDILKFDEWLHKKYGDYEDNSMSMKEFIINHYGEEANYLIESLL